MLIDRRSVYTPLYSGVYWDMQDVLAEDVDRIEVISGPGATLWGANAVNGVINIITRSASETQGAVLTVGGGNQQRGASVQYGGKIGDSLAYRAYAKTFYANDTLTAANAGAGDHWTKPQIGLRMDWTPSKADTVTLQADGYQGPQAQLGAPDEVITRANVSGRWTHNWSNGSALQIQSYFDRTARETQQDGGSFMVNTYDFDAQHSFTLAGRHEIVWGGGVRVSDFRIDGTTSLFFRPRNRVLTLGNLFVQDTIALTSKLRLTVGIKGENDPYSGVVLLPNLRLAFTPSNAWTLWAAASQAVRAPTPFDRDVVERSGGVTLLRGDPDFRTEKLTAYELGVHSQPAANISFSASAYYNLYDDLKSIELTPVVFFPLTWGNNIEGYTYGLEAWSDIKVASWWRLSPGFSLISEHLTFSPGATGAAVGVLQVANDPQEQATLKSSIDIGKDVSFDAALRYAGALPNPKLPAYTELNLRVGWNVTRHIQLAISGYNLLHAQHQELPAPTANAIPRSVYAEARLRF